MKDESDGRAEEREKGWIPASFTVEAAFLVPILLAVIFLLLQMTLYLHDSIWAETWLCGQTWKLRWSAETEETVDSLGIDWQTAPRLAVLRCRDAAVSRRRRSIQAEADFQVRLLPQFVTMIFSTSPENVPLWAEERIVDTPAFVRIAGAVLEEQE